MTKRRKERKSKKKIKRVNAWRVIAVVIVFVVLLSLAAWRQIARYEKGILSVYAKQQDGYVQLVLDQINLQDNRDDQKIVEDILGTLDTSYSHYWTLSEKNSLIFVKDVLETNRFKGFTTETYYSSDSADVFLEGLQENRVTHATIDINGREYVASGVNFAYNGKNYRMCLLSGVSSILEQNDYLDAKICLILLGMILFVGVVVGGVLLAIQAERWYRKYDKTDKMNLNLLNTVEALNRELTKKIMYDSTDQAFYRRALPNLLHKMEQRDVWPLEIVIVKAKKGHSRNFFLSEAQILCDEKTIRVILDDTYILLLDMRHLGMVQSERKRQVAKMDGEMVKRQLLEEKPDRSLEEIVNQLYEEVCVNG